MKKISISQRSTQLVAIALFLAVTQPSYAHPGHGLGEHGLAHLATSGYHIVILLGVALVLWSLTRFVRQTISRLILHVGAALALAAAAVLWRFSM